MEGNFELILCCNKKAISTIFLREENRGEYELSPGNGLDRFTLLEKVWNGKGDIAAKININDISFEWPGKDFYSLI